MRIGDRQKGFTLMELLVVLVILSALAGLVAPLVSESVLRAKESALREDLMVIRKAIDGHYADRGVYPDSLETLIDRRYLRSLPTDPVSGQAWKLVHSDTPEGGIMDVRSSAAGLAEDGTRYEQW